MSKNAAPTGFEGLNFHYSTLFIANSDIQSSTPTLLLLRMNTMKNAIFMTRKCTQILSWSIANFS